MLSRVARPRPAPVDRRVFAPPSSGALVPLPQGFQTSLAPRSTQNLCRRRARRAVCASSRRRAKSRSRPPFAPCPIQAACQARGTAFSLSFCGRQGGARAGRDDHARRFSPFVLASSFHKPSALSTAPVPSCISSLQGPEIVKHLLLGGLPLGPLLVLTFGPKQLVKSYHCWTPLSRGNRDRIFVPARAVRFPFGVPPPRFRVWGRRCFGRIPPRSSGPCRARDDPGDRDHAHPSGFLGLVFLLWGGFGAQPLPRRRCVLEVVRQGGRATAARWGGGLSAAPEFRRGLLKLRRRLHCPFQMRIL